jgi:hypothetical protein
MELPFALLRIYSSLSIIQIIVIIIIIIIINGFNTASNDISTINRNNRIAATPCSLGT